MRRGQPENAEAFQLGKLSNPPTGPEFPVTAASLMILAMFNVKPDWRQRTFSSMDEPTIR